MTKEQSLTFETSVKEAIENGKSTEEIVKLYGVSEYYVKKWSRQVYKNMDIDMFVRRRYSNIVCKIRYQVETKIGDIIQCADISEDDWDKLDNILKEGFYDFAKDIVKKN